MNTEEHLAAVTDGVHRLYYWFKAKVERCSNVMERHPGEHLFTVESEKTMCDGVLTMMQEFGLSGENARVYNPLGKAREALLECKEILKSNIRTGKLKEHARDGWGPGWEDYERHKKALEKIEEAL